MSKKLDKLIDEICSEVEKTVGHRKYVETFLQGIDFNSVDEGIIDEDYYYASDRLDDVFYYYEESLNNDEYYERYGDIFTDKVIKLLNELKKELSKFTESKKSATKSLKESKDITIEEFISDYKNNDCFSIRDKENGHESECFWGSKKDVLDSDYRLFTVLDTDVNKETDDTILYIDLEENAWVESKKSATKSIVEEYDPTDDIINNGNSVGMDYETFLKFAEKQDYKFNVTDATFYFGINSNIKIEGRVCSCIPSEDGILIIDNHSSIEIPRKDIDEVSGVSLNSKNVLRMDVFTKDGDALTVWWEL